MTRALYLHDTYLLEEKAIILSSGEDEKGTYLILDQTIFYPQGGGQPADHGVIHIGENVSIAIIFTRQVDCEIRHYFTGPLELDCIGKEALCKVDKDRRIINARYHTAAHLLGNVAESVFPQVQAVKGHSFPKEGYVEFIGSESIDSSLLDREIRSSIEGNFQTKTFEMLPAEFEEKFYKLPYLVPAHKKFRAMQIGEFAPVPCGGTHLKNMEEIGTLVIRKIGIKKDRIKISYEVG